MREKCIWLVHIMEKGVFTRRCDINVLNKRQDQYNETNMLHFLLNLLTTKSLYVFRAYQVPFVLSPPEDEQVMLETCTGP
jgi:hypothetical protein